MKMLIKKILLWLVPVLYLVAAALIYFRGLNFLSVKKNHLMAFLIVAYALFRFYRAYNLSRSTNQ